MKKYIAICALILIAACKADESKTRELHKVSIQAFGSNLDISYIGQEQEGLTAEVESFVEQFNRSASTYDSTSLISRFNRSANGSELDSLNLFLIRTAGMIQRHSNGAYDIGIGALVNAWGFGFKNAEQMDSLKVDSLLHAGGLDKLEVLEDRVNKLSAAVELDYNSLAPGYAADLLGEFLESKGIQDYYINVGGELKCKGKNSRDTLWLIGIEKPIPNKTGVNEFQYLIHLHDEALATSGNYRKFYEKNGKRYAHTLDPRTGYPVQHDLLSATIVGPKGIICDALATTCMVIGREESRRFLKTHYPDYHYLFIYDGGEKGFQVEYDDALEQQLIDPSV